MCLSCFLCLSLIFNAETSSHCAFSVWFLLLMRLIEHIVLPNFMYYLDKGETDMFSYCFFCNVLTKWLLYWSFSLVQPQVTLFNHADCLK